MDPEFYAIILALVAANSGLWRVIDNYILGRSKCGSTACNKAVVIELEKKLTNKGNGRNPA